MLHQVAVRTYELGRLRGHDLDRKRLQSLLATEGQEGILLLLGLLGPGLLLDEDVLDRLDRLVAGGGGRRAGGGGVTVEILGLLALPVPLFVVARLFEVFHGPVSLLGRGILLPRIPVTSVPGVERGEGAIHSRLEAGAQPSWAEGEERRGPKRPLGPRRRGAAVSTQPLWSSVRPAPRAAPP